jgi:phosphatidylserine/phosphatidylglycerophosphate/cardiolipin synthase-like enzyme
MSTVSTSQLYDEKTFYQTFLADLGKCQDEVIIESPYVTSERMRTFDRIFQKLVKRGVEIYIITRDPKEHSEGMGDTIRN